jgi:hypothetical protein
MPSFGNTTVSEMTADRERHLLRMIRTLRCKGEAEGFRDQLKQQGEMTGELVAALMERERQIG